MKNIWIVNHNAIPPSLGGLCRHYYFSKYLGDAGYNIRIITASTIHNTEINMIENKALYLERQMDNVPYTFLRCSCYQGNGLSRIKNMLEFPLQLWKVKKHFEKPDIIFASSPDPFSAFAAIVLSKKLKVPSILEIRDLWPESIVCYKKISRKNPAIQALCWLERWMYKHCDRLIFTMEGGYDYILEQGWEKVVPKEKVFHINNGVDLEEFDYNKEHGRFADADLDDPNTFKVVYTGSVREVNRIDKLVNVAELLKKQAPKVKILIWGGGNHVSKLLDNIQNLGLDNITYKGVVNKKQVHYILSKADANLIQVEQTPIMRFGSSFNKFFEYLAAGKPILSTINVSYDLIKKYNCGIVCEDQSPQTIADNIVKLVQTTEENRVAMGVAARSAAANYCYRNLSKLVQSTIDNLLHE